MDCAGAGDHTVPVGAAGIHPEVLGAVPGEFVQLREAALVQERQHSLASCHLALGVLFLDGGGGTGMDRRIDATSQIRQLAGSGVDVDVHAWNLSVRAKRVPRGRLWSPVHESVAMPGQEADQPAVRAGQLTGQPVMVGNHFSLAKLVEHFSRALYTLSKPSAVALPFRSILPSASFWRAESFRPS